VTLVTLMSGRTSEIEVTVALVAGALVAVTLAVWLVDALSTHDHRVALRHARFSLARLAAFGSAIAVGWALTRVLVWVATALVAFLTGRGLT
jgi:hypothetical protein